jgi:pyridoxal biosynthesis lyase PdxS
LSSFSASGEGKVLFDVLDVSIRNEARLAESALALPVLALEQVAFALFAAEYFPGARYFEALGDGFPCLCFS